MICPERSVPCTVSVAEMETPCSASRTTAMRTGSIDWVSMMFRKIIYAVCFVSVLFFAGFTALEINRTESLGESLPYSQRGPIILELFTSQGCSSCPSADKLLSRLAQDAKYKARIVPLAFHVDYWNNLGWKDPYSDHAWTRRQGMYTEALGEATMYTPQLVVQGQASMVGSNEHAILKSIDAQLDRNPVKQFNIAISKIESTAASVELVVSVQPGMQAGSERNVIVAALFENGLSTRVPAGENKGRTLKNNFVVRSLLEADAAVRQNKDTEIYQLAFDIADDWDLNKIGVAVWAQEARTMKIMAADVEILPEQ